MWFIGVEVEQETSAPPPKKNPGSAPVGVLSNSLKADLDDTIFAYDYHSQFGLLSKEKEKLTGR